MLLTIALCTHNHRDRLERTLRGVAEVRPPSAPCELLLVDNASSDGTSELLAESRWDSCPFPVRIVREEKLGLSNARNRAIAEARAEYIVFLDDDETPDRNWLTAYEAIIDANHPDAMGGRIDVMFEDGERPAWLQDELLGFLGRLDHGGAARRLDDPRTPIFGGNFAFRRAVFARVGQFDADLGRKGATNVGGEDTEMYRRLLECGCAVWWVPDALIYHRVRTPKLRRRYFLDLHYRQGHAEGARKRATASRLPPPYLFRQLWRACRAALSARLESGGTDSLRKEMNVAYFVGYITGWSSRRQTDPDATRLARG
jgi:glycosyltransferase involved in cell wall biosynthesis